MRFRGNQCPSISDFYSPADLSMPFEEVIVRWTGRREKKREGDVGGLVEFNVGSEMEQRCLRGLRCLMAELLRFDHLYLVASISIEEKGGSLIIPDSSFNRVSSRWFTGNLNLFFFLLRKFAME